MEDERLSIASYHKAFNRPSRLEYRFPVLLFLTAMTRAFFIPTKTTRRLPLVIRAILISVNLRQLFAIFLSCPGNRRQSWFFGASLVIFVRHLCPVQAQRAQVVAFITQRLDVTRPVMEFRAVPNRVSQPPFTEKFSEKKTVLRGSEPGLDLVAKDCEKEDTCRQMNTILQVKGKRHLGTDGE